MVIPDLNNDDQKRRNRDGKTNVKPLTSQFVNFPRFKTAQEYEDELIAAKYDSIKMQVYAGVYIDMPYMLFKLADYAVRHDDEQFAVTCLSQVPTNRLSSKHLEYIARRYKALNPYMPEITRAVTITAYCKMVDAKLKGIDCDSARMQNGDTMLIVTDQFNPSLNPLVVLSCFYDPSKETERYREAADSLIATYNQWSTVFKDTFARDFFVTLMDKGEYATVLNYFGRAPFKQFPDTNVDFTLDMLSCALATQNDSLATSYLAQAVKLDPIVTDKYWANYFNGVWDTFIADPAQIELADWLLENSASAPHNALAMAGELIERYWPAADATWDWVNLSDDTPEQIAPRHAILYILDKGLANKDGLYDPSIPHKLLYTKMGMITADPEKAAEVEGILNELTVCDVADVRYLAILQQAYIAGHGLDHPKEALKILKKHIKLIDNPTVREMWYDYMAALYTNLGKTKEAEKYRKLKETIKDKYSE